MYYQTLRASLKEMYESQGVGLVFLALECKGKLLHHLGTSHVRLLSPALMAPDNLELLFPVACELGENSRLSFAPTTTCETRRETSAIRGQKFHTDDVNLFRILTGALIGQPNNFA